MTSTEESLHMLDDDHMAAPAATTEGISMRRMTISEYSRKAAESQAWADVARARAVEHRKQMVWNITGLVIAAVVAICVLLLALFTPMASGSQQAASSTSVRTVPSYPKNYKLWIRIGRCEQPGSGRWGIRWSHPGPTYGGGLGIYIGTWRHWKPKHYPSTPGAATWRQQMIVANRIKKDVGISAWGCGRR